MKNKFTLKATVVAVVMFLPVAGKVNAQDAGMAKPTAPVAMPVLKHVAAAVQGTPPVPTTKTVSETTSAEARTSAPAERTTAVATNSTGQKLTARELVKKYTFPPKPGEKVVPATIYQPHIVDANGETINPPQGKVVNINETDTDANGEIKAQQQVKAAEYQKVVSSQQASLLNTPH